jgi:hypothetical protein
MTQARALGPSPLTKELSPAYGDLDKDLWLRSAVERLLQERVDRGLPRHIEDEDVLAQVVDIVLFEGSAPVRARKQRRSA